MKLETTAMMMRLGRCLLYELLGIDWILVLCLSVHEGQSGLGLDEVEG